MFDGFTIAFSYYENPEMLKKQFDCFFNYPEPLKKGIEVLIVDDGSQIYPMIANLPEEVKQYPNLSLYAIKEDIPWNYIGARNLAFTVAKHDWIMNTDIDHVLPEQSAINLFHVKLKANKCYIPGRLNVYDCGKTEKVKAHGNSFVMTKELFWKIGGYDEDFAGYWNGAQNVFRKNARKLAKHIPLEKYGVYLHHYLIPSPVSVYSRRKSKYDVRHNEALHNRAKSGDRYVPANPLRFTWEKLN